MNKLNLLHHENIFINLNFVKKIQLFTANESQQLNETVIKNLLNGHSYIVFTLTDGLNEVFDFPSDDEGMLFFKNKIKPLV